VESICLVNDAGVFIGKPFTDYTADDYATIITADDYATIIAEEWGTAR
jgi:hypothetical protein